MDQLLFRFWCVKRNKMIEFGLLGLDQGYIISEGISIDGDDTIMQYTGKKDKKGVAIFGDDIVKTFRKQDGCVLDQVVLDHGCWRFKAICDPNSSLNNIPIFNFESKDIEVIGNIYKNKELLGGRVNEE